MSSHSSKGLTAVGIFLLFGFAMASLAGITLISPETPLERIWAFNPAAYTQLRPLGRVVGFLFLLLGGALALAAIGWFRRRYWGWMLAVLIIATQVLGDGVNLIRGDVLRGSVGVVVAGCLLAYLLSRNVRREFPKDTPNNRC